MITGLNTDSGFELLQRYVDIRQDIQTAALLVARFPALSYEDDSDPSKQTPGQMPTLLIHWYCGNAVFVACRYQWQQNGKTIFARISTASESLAGRVLSCEAIRPLMSCNA